MSGYETGDRINIKSRDYCMATFMSSLQKEILVLRAKLAETREEADGLAAECSVLRAEVKRLRRAAKK